MDQLKSLFLIVTLFILGSLFVFIFTSGAAESERFLSVAEILVSVATFTSVVFGIIIYLESNILSGRILKMRKNIQNQELRVQKELQDLAYASQLAYYELAKSGLEALWAIVYTASPDQASLAMQFKSVRLQEVRVHLTFGSPQSVEIAIEILFKESKKDFLSHEALILAKSTSWSSDDKNRVLKRFSNMKRRVVDSCVFIE